jgi:hypothetical protein
MTSRDLELDFDHVIAPTLESRKILTLVRVDG